MAEGDAIKTTIAEDIQIVGAVKCASNIRLDGKLEGDLSCSGSAVIGGKAVMKGNLNVESISIEGQVDGNVTARDRIELKSTARLNGDIRAKRLTVEDGVTFVGKSEVNPSGPGKPDAAPKAQPEDGGSAEGDKLAEAGKPKGGVFRK
jgi:cytoskeletal protein CcmA (bactofilin family)